jgi:hypothetical protein
MKLQLKALALSVLSICTLQALADDRTSITQEGSRSVATITQGHFIGSFQSNADIRQGRGTDNYATVEQTGYEAHATITQLDNHQAARVVQSSDAGTTIVWQGGGPGNSADINQTGIHSLMINVRQFGSDNSAIVTQDNAMGAGADVRQTGIGNRATVTEAGLYSQRASIEQVGVDNKASIDLPAIESLATITQYGVANAASIHDQGSENTSLIDQRGANNLAQIDLTGSYIDATIRQHGIGNRGYITSFGDGFTSDQVNTATILQGGQDNLARITQTSAGAAGYTATIAQNYSAPGYGNIATILQR